MSQFSEQLKSAVARCGVSVNDISRQSGVSTALLYKFQNGTRIPDGTDTVERIFDTMLMSSGEREELLRAYRIEKIGVGRYKCYEAMKRMLSNLANIPALTAKRGVVHDLAIPQIVEGGGNLNSVVQYLLEYETSKAGGMIRLMVPLQYGYCFECLCVALSDCHKDFGNAVHLFNFHSTATDDALLHNMQIIGAVLPNMMTLVNYEPRYCYQPDPDPTVSIYPYYLITSLGVLQISADFQNGLFHDSPELIRVYQLRFDEIAKNHTPVMNAGTASLETYFYAYHQMGKRHSREGIRPTILAPVPCVLPCLGIERAMKYLPPEMEEIPNIAKIAELYFNSSNAFGYVNFFSVEGLVQLLKTGQIMELQGPFVPRVGAEDVVFMVEEFLCRAKSGNITIHIFRTDVFHTMSPMSLNLWENQLLTFCDLPSHKAVFADVTEKTLYHVVRGYIAHAELLGDVYSHEDSIALAEQTLRKFQAGLL